MNRFILGPVAFFLYIMPVMGYTTSAPMTEPTQNCPEFPYFKPTTGPFAVLNCDMHKAYDHRVEQIVHSFGAPGGRPIVLNLGGTLILKYNGKIKTIDITPRPFQELKALGHGVFASYLILSQQKEGPLDDKTKQLLIKLRMDMVDSAKNINAMDIPPHLKKIIHQMVWRTDHFTQQIIKTNDWTMAALSAFYIELQPALNQIIDSAVKIELSTLDKAINDWLLHMPKRDKHNISIAIATAHQARANEISVQYFSKKFNKQVGIGAQNEKGMIVVESSFEEKPVLLLLARHFLDREVGQVIFNNPVKMQTDLFDVHGLND